MATKKTDKFAEYLAKRESEAVEKATKARETLAVEEERAAALEESVAATEEALEEVEDRARAGHGEATGLELVTARADHEVATIGLAATEKRAKRLTDWLSKVNHRKDVAVIVRDALLVHLLPGAPAYATFHTGGFAKDEARPGSLPALVVTQMDGSVAADGVGAGQLRIVWFRSALHSPLDADRLRAALEAAGFRIDRSGLNDGLTVMSGKEVDEVTVRLHNVADTTPVVSAPMANVDDWDDALARDICLSHEFIDAEGCGGSILSSEVDGDIRTTVVRLNVAAKAGGHGVEKHDINLSWIFNDRIGDMVGKVRRGAGRCTESKPVSASGGRGAAFLDNGKQVLSAEFIYKGRVG